MKQLTRPATSGALGFFLAAALMAFVTPASAQTVGTSKTKIKQDPAAAELNGLLAIKAHIVKNACGHIALDGMDELYRNYLDLMLSELERRYGDSLWWTSMAEIAALNLQGEGQSELELTGSEA